MVGRASSRRVVSVISPVLLSYRHQTGGDRQRSSCTSPPYTQQSPSHARAHLRDVEVDADEHALVGQHALGYIRERGLANETEEVRATRAGSQRQ